MSEECAATPMEREVQSTRIYDGRVLNLRVDTVSLSDGRKFEREVVEHEPAVVIVAEDEKGRVLLIEQFRYPVNRVITELPAGVVNRGEDAETAAVRELREETGWKPESIAPVLRFYSSPGYATEELILYYAAGLTFDKLPQDEDEFIVSRFVPKEEARRLIESGEIADAKTLAGLYWWLAREKCDKPSP